MTEQFGLKIPKTLKSNPLYAHATVISSLVSSRATMVSASPSLYEDRNNFSNIVSEYALTTDTFQHRYGKKIT